MKMSEQIKVADLLDHLSQELEALGGDCSMPSISGVELDLAFTANMDESGTISLAVVGLSDQHNSDVHRLRIKLDIDKRSNGRNAQDVKLPIAGQTQHDSEFEDFKARFKASVKRHGGVPPNPKTNVFD